MEIEPNSEPMETPNGTERTAWQHQFGLGSFQGRSDGVDIGIYTTPPKKKSAQVNFLWGKMTSERLFNSFIHPKNFYTPRTNFWLRPWFVSVAFCSPIISS